LTETAEVPTRLARFLLHETSPTTKPTKENTMQTCLKIQDLTPVRDIDRKAMSAIVGGTGDEANALRQSNFMALFAPVSVGNGSNFGGGPVIFQVESNPLQVASNVSESSNSKSAAIFGKIAEFL
jgi:hypothetical protein